MTLKDEFENLPGERLRRELEKIPGMNLNDELERRERLRFVAEAEERESLSRHAREAVLERSDYLPGGISYIPPFSPKLMPVPYEQRQSSEFMEGLKAHAKRLEESLQEDQELLMYCWHGHEKMRVLEISMPSHNVVALHCINADNCQVHITGHMNSVNFSFLIHTIVPPEVRTPIGFNMPNSSED
jgi:hypothetical protein